MHYYILFLYLPKPHLSKYGISNKQKKRARDSFKNKDYSEAQNEKTKYFYDSIGRIIKEIYFPYYNKLGDIVFRSKRVVENDSTVIKYKYIRNNISKALQYNEEGKKIATTYFHYNTVENRLSLSNYKIRWDEETMDSAINYFFDENCYLKKITSVQFSGNTKYCEKYVYNADGGLREEVSFELKNRKNKDFEYYDDDDEYIRENSLYNETKWNRRYYDEPKYEYDGKENWIIRRIGDHITRRKITYR